MEDGRVKSYSEIKKQKKRGGWVIYYFHNWNVPSRAAMHCVSTDSHY